MNAINYAVMVPMFVFIVVLCLALYLATQLGDKSRSYQTIFEKFAGQRLRAQFLYVNPQRVFSVKLIMVLVGAVVTWALSENFILAFFGAFICGFFPNIYIKRMLKQRRERFRHQLPDVLMLLAGNLRAGSGLMQAMDQMTNEMPAPARQEFALMLREMRLGVALSTALTTLERRMPLEEVALLGSATRIATENGANLAEAFESLSSTLRAKIILEDKIRALTAQGRLQSWVIAAMPLMVLLMLLQIQPDSMRPLTHTYLGWAVLALVVVLEFLGLAMIRRIVSIDI